MSNFTDEDYEFVRAKKRRGGRRQRRRMLILLLAVLVIAVAAASMLLMPKNKTVSALSEGEADYSEASNNAVDVRR